MIEIEQGLASHQTHYRSYRETIYTTKRVFSVKEGVSIISGYI